MSYDVEPTPFVRAMNWHRAAVGTRSSTAPSYQHTQAIIDGYEAIVAQRDARIEQLERKYAEACALIPEYRPGVG